jgi:transcriptional regulator with XRE-family HTH domain
MSENSLPHRNYLNHDTSAQLDAWNIQAARLARGMTEAQLADAVGARESGIRNIERDAKKSGGFFLNSDQTYQVPLLLLAAWDLSGSYPRPARRRLAQRARWAETQSDPLVGVHVPAIPDRHVRMGR